MVNTLEKPAVVSIAGSGSYEIAPTGASKYLLFAIEATGAVTVYSTDATPYDVTLGRSSQEDRIEFPNGIVLTSTNYVRVDNETAGTIRMRYEYLVVE